MFVSNNTLLFVRSTNLNLYEVISPLGMSGGIQVICTLEPLIDDTTKSDTGPDTVQIS